MNSTDYTRLVRVTLFYYFEGAATALKRIGDQNLSEFRAFSVGYQSPRKSMGEQDPVLSGPRVVLWPPFRSRHPDFRGLACSVLSDLRVPHELWGEILENLTGQKEEG